MSLLNRKPWWRRFPYSAPAVRANPYHATYVSHVESARQEYERNVRMYMSRRS